MWQRVKQAIKGGIFVVSTLLATLIFVHSWRYFATHDVPFLWNKQEVFLIYLPALYGHISTSSFISYNICFKIIDFSNHEYYNYSTQKVPNNAE